MLTDGRTTDTGVTGILIAHLGAFGSGELKIRIPIETGQGGMRAFEHSFYSHPLNLAESP